MKKYKTKIRYHYQLTEKRHKKKTRFAQKSNTKTPEFNLRTLGRNTVLTAEIHFSYFPLVFHNSTAISRGARKAYT